jgi:hypothetical protein
MPEHWIRLRGGWECRPANPEDNGGTPQRITLPCSWSIESATVLQLSRRFQTPRLDPAREALFLRLELVSGLVEVLLNDCIIAGPAHENEVMSIALGENLPPRNHLVLNVKPTIANRWGEIALVITDRGARQ